MKKLISSSALRTISTLLAVMLALPLTWKGLTGIYLWLSPFIMLNSGLALKSFAWLNFAALAVLLPILFRKRWFCHNLCPAGWCLDHVAALSRRPAFSYNNLPYIGKWLAVISLASSIAGIPLFIYMDPLAVFSGFFTVFYGSLTFIAILSLSGFLFLLGVNLIFPGIWCAKLCPLGGFQLLMADLKAFAGRLFMKRHPDTLPLSPGRRYFIFSGAGLAAGLLIPRFLKPQPEEIIRPPAAAEPPLLYSLCTRCGSCNKACPTGIIKPHSDFTDIISWMTPVVSFKSGYCLETCNLCGRVCPTGAIALFSSSAKSQLFMGTAEVHLENCLLFNNIECIKCRESCKYAAIDFREQGSLLKMMPVVNRKKCVGCGACEVICPASCINIKTVGSEKGIHQL